MSKKTNNKQVRRNPNTEEATCQTTIPDENPIQRSVLQQNTGCTSQENSNFPKTRFHKSSTEWYERAWASKVREIGIELIIIIMLNCVAAYLGFKEQFYFTIVAIGCAFVVFIVTFCLLKGRKYKETICKVTVDTAKKVDELCEEVSNYRTKTHEYINCSENRHIKLVSSTKRLTISKRKRPKRDESKFVCKLEHVMEIYNYSSSAFENYVYDISSSLGVSQGKEYIIRIGSDTTKGLDSFKKSGYEITYDNGESRKGMKISLPVQIESHESKTLSVIEPDTPSFNGISKCSVNNPVDDWLSISIHYPTDLLSFELVLDQSMSEYQFLKKDSYTSPDSGTLHPDSYTTSVCCLVLDRSEQVVVSERTALKAHEIAQPVFDKDDGCSRYNRISWRIPDPKIGYRYQLFFTIEKK